MSNIKGMRRLIKPVAEEQNSTGPVFMFSDALGFSLPSFAHSPIILPHSHLFCKLGWLGFIRKLKKGLFFQCVNHLRQTEFSPQRIWICEQQKKKCGSTNVTPSVLQDRNRQIQVWEPHIPALNSISNRALRLQVLLRKWNSTKKESPVSATPNASTAIYNTAKQDFTTLESSVTAVSFSPGCWGY